MDATRLRDVQAPLKKQYQEDPGSAVVTLHADGELDGTGIACRVRTAGAIAGALAEAGLHPATGGDGTQLCSGDMLLEALVACAGVTMRAVATSMGLEVSGTVRAEGDLDFRGTLGVDKEAPVGFRDVRLSFALDTTADEDQVARLVALTERYCVVLQTIKGNPHTEVAVTTAR
ncbi:OsmC family protein [Pseudonocardia sp. RS010]|uniref:OsmC family protein n=1 Tax=Pseudonocardia sp. RS010 TaxID=3385979 RepID=UPI0039A0FF1A